MQSSGKEGLWATVWLVPHWLLSKVLLLAYEPARKIPPITPSNAFERGDGSSRVALQIHLFHIELIDELIFRANQIPYCFDCYISTDSDEKARTIRAAFTECCRAMRIEVTVYPNRGRDIAPLLVQMAPVLSRYDYVCHLHSKYSVHGGFGNRWRTFLLDSLLFSPEHIAGLLAVMEREPTLGMIFQRTYWRVKPSKGWKNNREEAQALLAQLGIEQRLPFIPVFPAGNMFWARTEAIASMFALDFEAFPSEQGQLDGTIAHAIERCWSVVARSRGFSVLRACRPSGGSGCGGRYSAMKRRLAHQAKDVV